MREIKFRAISECRGEGWVYGDLRHYARNPHTEKWTIYDPATGIETDIVEDTIGQKVWHPRNCAELYEGDIIGFDDWAFTSRERKKMRHHVGVIEWNQEYGHYHVRCEDGIYVGNDIADPQLLGNIYDNPELIEARH